MKDVVVKKLANGAQVMWSLPTGGFGHAADEQPLPYIRYKGKSLTPRYGGDESIMQAGYESIPLPSFRLVDGWPLSQKIFNLFRRRINIYWRNLFATLCRPDNKFLFSEQLNYKAIEEGFYGFSPLVSHIRQFEFAKNQISIIDIIEFKVSMRIDEFVVSNSFVEDEFLVFRQRAELNSVARRLSSSTGSYQVCDVYANALTVRKGFQVRTKQVYEVLSGLA